MSSVKDLGDGWTIQEAPELSLCFEDSDGVICVVASIENTPHSGPELWCNYAPLDHVKELLKAWRSRS